MRAIKINPSDNVAVVLQPTPIGSHLDVEGRIITAIDDIPVGHKIAVAEIHASGDIIKYGKVIGLAASDIHPGEHVHCHNVVDITEELCNQFAQAFRNGGTST